MRNTTRALILFLILGQFAKLSAQIADPAPSRYLPMKAGWLNRTWP
jgi:hypothetical protein